MANKGNVAGKIVRIYLENFMSYDKIEIHPGDHLNLVIGPNGTGKSSIVCAVLLCLGGKLKDLGRADQISSYVKTGCDQSRLEVELYNPAGKNVVVSRKITSSNESEFRINGIVSNGKQINEIRKEYNIQIGNLCTFLPQEKVQDFAKLNNEQLLNQTQRIVGNGELLQLHEELKSLQSAIADQENLNIGMQNDLEIERQRNDRLKDKIKCFKEKQLLCDKLDDLNRKKAWILFSEEVKKKREIDEDTRAAESAHSINLNNLEKCKKDIKQFEGNLSSYQQKLNEAKKNEAGKRSALENWITKGDSRVDEVEDLRNSMQLKIQEEENKKNEMMRCKEDVDKLKNDLKNFDEKIGAETDLEKQRQEVDYRLNEIHKEETNLNQKKFDLEEEEDTLRQECRNTVAECENLKKRRDNRLGHIKRHEPDVYTSMEWLKKNRHLFQSRIYDPMLLELDVPNSKMAKFVESRLGPKDLISFTCTNPDDLNLMIQKLRTEKNLKINVICSDEFDNTQYAPDIQLSDLRDLGFYAYMKDMIEGPEEILRFLCKTYKIHCIPVGDEKVKANSEKVPQIIPIFYSENHMFSVKHSVYSNEKSTIVNKLGEPRFFSHSTDERKIQMLMEKEKNLQNEINNKLKNIKKVDDQLMNLRKDLDEVKKRKKQLGTWLEDRKQIQINLKRATDKHKHVKDTLRDPAEIEMEMNKKRQVLSKDLERNFNELKEASIELEKATLNRQKHEITYKVNRFGIKQLFDNKIRLEEKLLQSEKQLRAMKERQKEAEYRCRNLKENAKKLTGNIAMGEKGFQKFQDRFRHLPNTVDEIEEEIEETQAKADFLQGGSLQIIHEYEEREKNIERLSASLDSSRRKLEMKKEELKCKRDEWLNPINELVSNINANFEKFFQLMDCAGEVSFVHGENENDFDHCGIKIKVKFRNEAPFQELSRYFQSGGERAVTIAIFLLSLQELISVPFRFVDEINQGMDPINERRIMELIIKVTAPKHSSQYFFVTPKLLPDIECTDTVTVLCIYNGPNAISSTEWDMKKFLDQMDCEEDD